VILLSDRPEVRAGVLLPSAYRCLLLVVTGIEGIDEAVDQFGAADDFQTFKSEQPEHPCSPALDERDGRQVDRDVLSASQSSLALRPQDRYQSDTICPSAFILMVESSSAIFVMRSITFGRREAIGITRNVGRRIFEKYSVSSFSPPVSSVSSREPALRHGLR